MLVIIIIIIIIIIAKLWLPSTLQLDTISKHSVALIIKCKEICLYIHPVVKVTANALQLCSYVLRIILSVYVCR